ncbi:MAG TPA: glycosyltransferase, partial [Candidatus Binataceae bacterium]|nr:glycosyltransferase [Candidatus Binataceae bacterium]
KLLFILPNLNAGGAERTMLQLLGELSARGFEPTIFLITHEGEFLEDVPRGVRVEWGLEPGQKLYRNLPRIMRTLLRYARASDVVVGALEHESTYFAWLAGRMARRPVVGWIHAVMSEELRGLSPLHTRIGRQIYPRVERLVCPSQAAADSLGSMMTLDLAKLAIIPSHVDCDRLQTLARQPLPEWAAEIFRKPTVINVGRMVPSKGLDLLIRAHALMRGAGLDHNLLILGQGRSRGELENLAESLGVRASVFMPGFMRNPYALMKAAAVFALSSRFESLPLVLVEALAIGSAIVATDCQGGPREVLQRGRNGLMVAANDETALASGISRLLRDRAMRDELKTAAPIRARDFSADKVVPRWERLLTELG